MRFLSFLPLFILLQYSVCGQEAPTLTETSDDSASVSALILGADELPVAGVVIFVNGVAAGAAGEALNLPLGVELHIAPAREGWTFCPEEIVLTLAAEGELEVEFEATELRFRGVIVEDFTNISCPGCPQADEALWAAREALGGRILPIAWHGSWPNPGDPFLNFNRVANLKRVDDFYGLLTLPQVFVNGSAVSDPLRSDLIQGAMAAQRALLSPVSLELTLSVTGDDYRLDATGTTHFDPGGGDWRLYLILYETLVVLEQGGGNGQTEFRNTVRYVNLEGDLLGKPVELDPCVSFSASATFTVDDGVVAPANLRALAFIQNSDGGEILDFADSENGGP